MATNTSHIPRSPNDHSIGQRVWVDREQTDRSASKVPSGTRRAKRRAARKARKQQRKG
jgi:hypothetical protein